MFNSSQPSDKYNYTVYQLDRFYKALEGTDIYSVHILLSFVSITSSVASVLVLSRKCMASFSMNQLIIALEVSNLLFVFLFLPIWTMRYQNHTEFLLGEFYHYLSFIVVSITWGVVFFSNWLTVAIGVWRCFAIVNPLRSITVLTKSKARLCILLTMLLSFLPIIFRFLRFTIVKHQVDYNAFNITNVYIRIPSKFATSHETIFYSGLVFIIILYYLLPGFCLFFINVFLVRALVRAYSQRIHMMEGRSEFEITAEYKKTVKQLILLLTNYIAVFGLVFISPGLVYFEELAHSRVFLRKPYLRIQYCFYMFFRSLSFVNYFIMSDSFRMVFKEKVLRRKVKAIK